MSSKDEAAHQEVCGVLLHARHLSEPPVAYERLLYIWSDQVTIALFRNKASYQMASTGASL